MPISSPSPDARPRYQKLPGWAPLLHLMRGALFLGEDCLVQTRTGLYRERYQRYDYAAIQALLLRRTARGVAYNVILIALTTACALCVYAASGSVGAQGFFGTIGAFWLILLSVNAARGATCRCQIQTALGPKPLPTLSRMRPARKAMRLIAERVEAAQGALTPETAAGQMEEFLHRKTREQPPQSGAAAGAVAPRAV